LFQSIPLFLSRNVRGSSLPPAYLTKGCVAPQAPSTAHPRHPAGGCSQWRIDTPH
jgi:hypothetical protein